MQNGSDEHRIKEALMKEDAFGKNLNLSNYEDGTKTPEKIDDLTSVSDDLKNTMENVGVVSSEEGRSGTIMFIDNGMSHCSNKEEEGLEILTYREAMKKYDGLPEYNWKAVDPAKDKYTAKSYLEDADGYFIRVKAGYQIKNPIQTCMLVNKTKGAQTLHNIIVIEENASLDVITGCATSSHTEEALHVGVSEIYIKDGGSLAFSMIHNWSETTGVRPRTVAILGKNAKYQNNYVLLKPVGSMQSNPSVFLNGEGGSVILNSMCLAHGGCEVDMGGTVFLNAPNTTAEIMSRSISKGIGRMVARGKLVGNAPGAKAHLECRSLVLNDGGITLAIPELESSVADVEMTHEAAVGKIARDQIEYLMSRGLSEDEAVSMIVRGFLVGGIKGLPDNLRKEIDTTISATNLGS